MFRRYASPGLLAALLLAVTSGLSITMHASPAAAQSVSYTKARTVGDFSRIGHRGFPYHGHTENTHLSFFDAYRYGATAEETDPHLTKDDVAVLMHDPTMDRTTNCRGPVRDLTYARFSRCRADDGQRLWTVNQLLAWDKQHGMNQVLDFKWTGWRAWTPELLRQLTDHITELRMTRRVVFMSNSPGFLARLKSVAPQFHTQWIASDWPGVAKVKATADGVNLYSRYATKSHVTALHAAGLTVWGRNTDVRSSWDRFRAVHVNGFLVNELITYNKRYHYAM
jgi:glycerophosphoryl diester phosphodiesterase